ncbi:MAG: DNA polymerase ligase N-terminal domain-containing protein [Planctomycetaceae bacterium]
MPRFAILTHDHPFLHWDLLLEQGDVLRAWRLLAEPLSVETIEAEPLPDHRPLYLDYEGPIGGDRGSVTRWDAGTYDIRAETPAAERHAEPVASAERIEIDFAGTRLRGTFVLECRGDEDWQLHSPPASPCA